MAAVQSEMARGVSAVTVAEGAMEAVAEPEVRRRGAQVGGLARG